MVGTMKIFDHASPWGNLLAWQENLLAPDYWTRFLSSLNFVFPDVVRYFVSPRAVSTEFAVEMPEPHLKILSFFFRSSSLTFDLVIGLFPEWIRSNGKESGCGDHQHQALLREAGLTTCPAVCLAPLLCRLLLPKFPHPLPLPHSLGMQETPTHHQYQPRPLQRVLCHPHPHFLVSQFHPHPLEFHLHSPSLVCHPHHHLLASEVQAWALEMELEWSSAGSHLFDQVGKPGSLVPAAPP